MTALITSLMCCHPRCHKVEKLYQQKTQAFCLDFLTSGELIGYVNLLIGFYETWPKSPSIIMHRGFEVFCGYFCDFLSEAFSWDELCHSTNTPFAKVDITEKNSHSFAVHHLLIDTVFCFVVCANKKSR